MTAERSDQEDVPTVGYDDFLVLADDVFASLQFE
jgi:hypothetical protein